MRLLAAILLSVFGCLFVLSPEVAAQPTAQKRVAFVIGNSVYKHTTQFINPKNDANDMGAALQRVGYQVIIASDLDKRAFNEKLLDFADALRGADIGVFSIAPDMASKLTDTIIWYPLMLSWQVHLRSIES